MTKEEGKAYRKKYYLENKDRLLMLHAEKVRRCKRNWEKKNQACLKRWRKLHPERHRAAYLLNRELYNGRMQRPIKCSKCGKESKIQGHHPDYSKPLYVVWLCIPCHLAEHGKAVRTYKEKIPNILVDIIPQVLYSQGER